MAPITLFFGTNSSGKSSIGQFLMMLKQTVESSDRKAVFYPGGNNTAVHLGSYREMVSHHDIEHKIEFGYTWDVANGLNIKDPISELAYFGNSLDFRAKVGFFEKGQNFLRVENLEYSLAKSIGASSPTEKAIEFSVGMKLGNNSQDKYETYSDAYQLRRTTGRPWLSGAPVRFYGFPDEVVAYYQNAGFVQTLNLLHEKLFGSLFYLGPLRRKAERLYSWMGTEPESVGFDGENTIAAMLAARNRKINLRFKSHAKPFEEIIASKLKQLALIDEFKVNQIAPPRQEYEVKVCAEGSSDAVDLPDVGFGVSQVLPVLVQCFYAPANSVILMEQPEIHLHPSAQSALADVMIDVIKSREGGKDRNIQLIIETHSEHFLRRLQRRIAEDIVSQNDVSAYFANKTTSPSVLKPLQIDDCGNIGNWPEGFFGDEMADIIAQSKASLNRKMKTAGKESGQ
jgi:predicted ATPase